MRAPSAPAAPLPKGEGGGVPRRGREPRPPTKGPGPSPSPRPNKQKVTVKNKPGRSKNMPPPSNRGRGQSPPEMNNVGEEPKVEKVPVRKAQQASPVRGTKGSPKRTPTKASPERKKKGERGRPPKSGAKSTPKGGKRSPSKTPRSSSRSPRRGAKCATSQVALANGSEAEDRPRNSPVKDKEVSISSSQQERIAKSIETVINAVDGTWNLTCSPVAGAKDSNSCSPQATKDKAKPKTTLNSPDGGYTNDLWPDPDPLLFLLRDPAPRKRGRPKGSKNKIKLGPDGNPLPKVKKIKKKGEETKREAKDETPGKGTILKDEPHSKGGNPKDEPHSKGAIPKDEPQMKGSLPKDEPQSKGMNTKDEPLKGANSKDEPSSKGANPKAGIVKDEPKPKRDSSKDEPQSKGDLPKAEPKKGRKGGTTLATEGGTTQPSRGKGKRQQEKLHPSQKSLLKKGKTVPQRKGRVISSKAVKLSLRSNAKLKTHQKGPKGSSSPIRRGNAKTTLPGRLADGEGAESPNSKGVGRGSKRKPLKQKSYDEVKTEGDEGENVPKKAMKKVPTPEKTSVGKVKKEGVASQSYAPDKLKKEVMSDGFSSTSSSDSEDDGDTEFVARPPKKALKQKWGEDVKKRAKRGRGGNSGARGGSSHADGKQFQDSVKRGPRRAKKVSAYFPEEMDTDESDSDEETRRFTSRKDSTPATAGANRRSRHKRPLTTGCKRKRKSDSPEEALTRAPKRAVRMASLNALAVMACMNEDAKLPLPSPPQLSPQETPSMALVPRESTIACNRSGDESEDSDDAGKGFDSSSHGNEKPGSRRSKAEAALPVTASPTSGEKKGSKTRRRRRGELDVTMDMKDMVVTKRMASLNASAIMTASYSTEARRKTPPSSSRHHGHSSSSVTNVDIKRKISSFKATKASSSSKSVITTVQETLKKKVKKGDGGSREETEVEKRIIVKKRVRRRSGHVSHRRPTSSSDEDGDDANPSEEEDQLGEVQVAGLLPKGRDPTDGDDDPGRLLLESALTLVTTQTAPQTVTLSGVSKYCITSADGRTTTVVQQVQRKSTASTSGGAPPPSHLAQPPTSSVSSSHRPPLAPPVNSDPAIPHVNPVATIPTAHIPPTQHVQVPHHDIRGPNRGPPPSYSPLGALEVMQPLMHPHPPPPSSHYVPYPHPPHGGSHPLPHPHHIHHHPATPGHMPPHHHPSSPYPPLSPHSPPYPPPPQSSSGGSSSSSPSPSSPTSVGYRSPPGPTQCQTGSPKPMGPAGPQAFNRDPSPSARMAPSPNGPGERHHSAFSAPMSSSAHAHAQTAVSAAAHGYQPVSGPIPTVSANTGSYKTPPQGSPGGNLAPPPYSSPSRMTSPPPPPNKSSPTYPGSSPHPYQSYPYSPAPPYDKYYPRSPAYHLYQPSYAPGGQYPPTQGEYGYQPPPPGTVHYSQESYTSYTLCVPAPGPHGPPQQAPHGPPQQASPTTHPPPPALALPPPPPPTSHHHTSPYASYHCAEYAPPTGHFTYPAAGPSQNMLCCSTAGSKNVTSGGSTAGGPPKGQESDCGMKRQSPSSVMCHSGYQNAPKIHHNQAPSTVGGHGPPIPMPQSSPGVAQQKGYPTPQNSPGVGQQKGYPTPQNSPGVGQQKGYPTPQNSPQQGSNGGEDLSKGFGKVKMAPMNQEGAVDQTQKPPSKAELKSHQSHPQTQLNQTQSHQPQPHQSLQAQPHLHSQSKAQSRPLRPCRPQGQAQAQPQAQALSRAQPQPQPRPGPQGSVLTGEDLRKLSQGKSGGARDPHLNSGTPPTNGICTTATTPPTPTQVRGQPPTPTPRGQPPIPTPRGQPPTPTPLLALAVPHPKGPSTDSSLLGEDKKQEQQPRPGGQPVERGRPPLQPRPGGGQSVDRGKPPLQPRPGGQPVERGKPPFQPRGESTPSSKSACGDGSSRETPVTKWVVQPSASSAVTTLASRPPPNSRRPATPPHHGVALCATSTTTSISNANTSVSTNSVMSTTAAPIVASLEKGSAPKTAVAHQTPSGVTSIVNSPKQIREPRWKEARKDVPQGCKELEGAQPPVSVRAGGRHLLCQPLPLGHTKMTSVLAKAKPSIAPGKASTDDPGQRNTPPSVGYPASLVHLPPKVPDGPGRTHPNSSMFPGGLTAVPGNQEKIGKGLVVPRKRGRPPKIREGTAGSPLPLNPPAASNGATKEHFWCAPGEPPKREELPRKRDSSLLKSSGAKTLLAAALPSSPRRAKASPFTPGAKVAPLHPEADPQRDVKPQREEGITTIRVKTEDSTIGAIKTERISPKQTIKPLNGDADGVFGDLPPPPDIKDIFAPPPPMPQGSLKKEEADPIPANPRDEKKSLMKRRDLDRSGGGVRFPVEWKLVHKGLKPSSSLGRGKTGKLKGGVRGGPTGPKVRKKASLLAYLKERTESDANNAEGQLMENELQKLMEEEESSPQKGVGAKPVSPFTGYSPVSIRGRRSSGAGRGKSVRKPKYSHGWNWEGDPHESKVWLRNDEVLMMRNCYKAMRHKEGDTIRVRDCVLLRSGPRKTDLPFVAKVAALWEDPETSDMMMSILWYYRPEHTDAGRREEDLADEVFASKHRDHLSVACIEDRCYVLTFNEYCRYRRLLRVLQERVNPQRSPVPDAEENYLRKERQPPGCVVQDLLFFCRKVYDYRQKRILKNPC